MLRACYGFQCLTRKQHGLSLWSWTFFERIQEYLVNQDMGLVVLARNSRCSRGLVPVAAFLRSGHEAICNYGVSGVNLQRLRANNSILWKGFERLVELSKSRSCFFRSSVGSSVLRQCSRRGGVPSNIRCGTSSSIIGRSSLYGSMMRPVDGAMRPFGTCLVSHRALRVPRPTGIDLGRLDSGNKAWSMGGCDVAASRIRRCGLK